jgi:putative hydrolase of the HAD superfamily
MNPALSHIRNWIFDLDNTLYPVSANLFALIDARIGQYVQNLLGLDAAEAHKVQKGYFHAHGTTLAGLMAEHGTDPHHYLADVHDVDMSVLEVNETLVAALARLPGRKLVFTNPDPLAYRGLCDAYGLDPAHSLFVEDMARNLKPAKAIGMTTVWIDNGSEQAPEERGSDRSYIDYTVNDLGAWLHDILETSE